MRITVKVLGDSLHDVSALLSAIDELMYAFEVVTTDKELEKRAHEAGRLMRLAKGIVGDTAVQLGDIWSPA